MLEKIVARLGFPVFSLCSCGKGRTPRSLVYEFVSGILPFPGDQWNFDMWIWAPLLRIVSALDRIKTDSCVWLGWVCPFLNFNFFFF